MNKTAVWIIIIAILVIGGYMYWGSGSSDVSPADTTGNETGTQMQTAEPVVNGTYTVVPEQSIVHWAGKKPLIEGYVDSGTIGVTGGSLTVADSGTTGTFTIDMDTLSVTDTPKKPGQESALEGHLKGDGWFNVAEFPTATFEITSTAPHADVADTHAYDITGNLTMHGVTNEVTFPAKVYLNSDGNLIADASFEIDRTKWGLTFASGSFFDNLADKVIDDMVALSFELTATPE